MRTSLTSPSLFFSLPRHNASTKFLLNTRSIRISSAAAPIDVIQPDFLLAEEPLAEYRFGGYHPTNIGDTLNGRYQIHRKLGWGGYSTVWLAQDKETDKYRSIKILTGIASHSSKLHELEYLQHTAKYDPMHPGYSRVIRLLDHFHHLGPHGHHLCLVTEVLGESVQSLTTYTELHNIHPAVAKGIARQVLQGVDYLHKSGIVHTDLKLDNFLVEIEDMDAYVQRALDSSSPEIYPEVQTTDGTPINYVASTPLSIPFEDVQNFRPVKIKIADLGVACWESKTAEHFTDQVQPPSIRAPEVYVGAGWDSKCDIWSLGLIILEMLRGKPPVPASETGEISSKVFYLVCYFGKFPIDLLERGKYSAKYFKPDGSFIYDLPEASVIPRWNALLNGFKKVLHPDELRRLTSFLEVVLSLRPEDRPTAAQLLDHEWVKSETLMLI